MAKGGFIKDSIKKAAYKKPEKLSYSAEKVLERLKDKKDRPTDDELVFYLNGVSDYEELGYISHLLSADRHYHKKKYGKDIYRDSATICALKRQMLRDDKQLCDILSKHLEWYAPNLKPTVLTFGKNYDYNEEYLYMKGEK